MRSESRHRAQTGNPHQECSWGGSGDRAGAQSQDHHVRLTPEMNGPILRTYLRTPKSEGQL